MAQSYGQAKIVVDDDMSKLSRFDDREDSFRRKCKIICTMGPACWDTETLLKMIDAGMNVCRLNFSHGDHEMHGQTVQRIREACKQRPEKPVAILLDTKGPEIRTGFFREDVGKSIQLEQGQELKLVTDYSFKGDKSCFALSYDKLPTSVKPGNTILCADGSLSLKVKSCGEDHVITEVMNNCKLGERKNCNLPGVKVELPVLQEKDVNDLLNFGIPQGVDFVAASFVQSADDVKLIRQTLGLRGRSIKIISKIENEEGLKNFDAILEASDGIMVARGDLGMEIPPEKVFLAQKMMIARCNLRGKPVVTATQMLESMTGLPRPTRAEASDVANAVLDGTDCVMLSGETAAGSFPLNAVSIMRHICEEAESVIEYESLYMSMRLGTLAKDKVMTPVESVCSSAVKATVDATCPLIVALTETGHTARIIAKYRPRATVLAITASDTTVRQLQCVRGVVAMHTASFVGTDSVIQKAIAKAKADGIVKSGDTVVAVHGQKEECPGHSNLLKMVVVP
jgi:pyruvate kinase